jgi:hypothetical protein
MPTARGRIALQSVGPSLHLDLSQSEGGSLADVEDLGGAEQRSEVGADLSFDLQGSQEAAQRDFALLAIAARLPQIAADA